MADYRQGEAANGVVLRIWRGKTTIFYECGKLCRASLGHAVLHQGQGMHRDRPVDGASQRSGTEREADKFAASLTMPSKLLRKTFKTKFLVSPFKLTPETEFALFGSDPKETFNSIRDLSRYLAKARTFNRRNFLSLAEQFNVSIETMAIRIEELGLVSFEIKD